MASHSVSSNEAIPAEQEGALLDGRGSAGLEDEDSRPDTVDSLSGKEQPELQLQHHQQQQQQQPEQESRQDLEQQQPSANNESPSQAKYSIFTTWEKRAMALAAAVTALFSPLSAQIYLPALNAISKDLHLTDTKVNLTITTYMIFQGITPMFISSLADSGGRRPAYLVCFVIYIAANIGLALAPSYGAILGLRCLQSAGSSSTVALCMAVVSDIVTAAERGQYVGFTTMPPVLGPALGPIIGGLLAQYLGWRSIFWFLAIFAGVSILAIACFMPETCRHIVGDGSLTPPLMYRSVWQILTYRKRQPNRQVAQSSFTFKPPNVLESVMLLFQKETGLLLGTAGLVFAGFYAIVSAMPTLFQHRYGYSDIEVGLMYLPISFGSACAAWIVGHFINRNYKRHHDRLGLTFDRSMQQDLSQFPIERARLEVGLPMLFLAGVSLIAWGWAMEAGTHVAALCIISVFLGIGIIGFNNTSSVLLIDVHPGKAGTATAANNLTRCLTGAAASAAIVPMMDAMGVGWAFTVVGGIMLLMIVPVLIVMTRGMAWRAELRSRKEPEKK